MKETPPAICSDEVSRAPGADPGGGGDPGDLDPLLLVVGPTPLINLAAPLYA